QSIKGPGGKRIIEAEFSAGCGGETVAHKGVPFFHAVKCPCNKFVDKSHRRGMCQEGAQAFAANADAQKALPAPGAALYQQILFHYYKDVSLVGGYGSGAV